MPTLYRIFGILLYCLIDMSNLIGIKKAWSPTAVVPLLEALALPISLEQQREAHAEYKHSPCYLSVKVRVCAYANMQKAYQ